MQGDKRRPAFPDDIFDDPSSYSASVDTCAEAEELLFAVEAAASIPMNGFTSVPIACGRTPFQLFILR